MNLFVLKYILLIGGILTSTALVAGPLNPQTIMANSSADNGISADSIYQFGSDVFYKELDKPGNEYLKAGVSGYATNLVQTDNQTEQYDNQWAQGVAAFKSGYNGGIDAFYELAGVPAMNSVQEKTAVCDKFKAANDDLTKSAGYFTVAKASSTAASAQGFEVGMVMVRVATIQQDTEDAEIACMKAVLANQAGDATGFGTNLHAAGADITDMKRIYPELGVLSSDFN